MSYVSLPDNPSHSFDLKISYQRHIALDGSEQPPAKLYTYSNPHITALQTPPTSGSSGKPNPNKNGRQFGPGKGP